MTYLPPLCTTAPQSCSRSRDKSYVLCCSGCLLKWVVNEMGLSTCLMYFNRINFVTSVCAMQAFRPSRDEEDRSTTRHVEMRQRQLVANLENQLRNTHSFRSLSHFLSLAAAGSWRVCVLVRRDAAAGAHRWPRHRGGEKQA
jgi:hypothetical protein